MSSASHGSSAASRVFSIPELVAFIVDHLDNGTSANIASTCKSIHHAASVRIWQSVYYNSLLSLVDIVFGEEEYTPGGRDASINARWARFSYYSALVKDVELVLNVPSFPLYKKLNRLSALLPTKSWLLPNLRRIKFDEVYGVEGIEVACRFLCPSLSQVELGIIVKDSFHVSIQEQVHIVSFLDKLALLASDLTAFGIHGMDDAVVPAFTPALRKIVALPLKTFFTGPCIEPEVFGDLARSLTLTDLELYCHNASQDPEPFATALSTHISPHSRLSRVRFVTGGATFHALLRALRSTSLQTIEVELEQEYGPSVSRMDQLFSDIVYFSSTLQHVDLELDLDGRSIRWTTFKPFEVCRRMRSFGLSLRCGALLELRDDHIISMAKAWPLLERLNIDWLCSYNGNRATRGLLSPVKLTLNGLAALAQYCPEVVELGLTYFDTSGDIKRLPQFLRLRKMQRIDVAYAEVNSVDDVALFISLTWSSAQVVGKNYHPKWTRVNESVRLLALHSQLLAERDSGLTQLLDIGSQ